MSTRLFDWLGHLAISCPRGVLTLYAIALLITLPFLFTSPYFLSPDGIALLIKIAGRRPVHDMASAKATVALIEQASDTLRVRSS